MASSLRDLEPRVVQMWFKSGVKTGHPIVISGITPHSIELTSKRFYCNGGSFYQVNFRLFADAARPELPKVTFAHDKHT